MNSEQHLRFLFLKAIQDYESPIHEDKAALREERREMREMDKFFSSIGQKVKKTLGKRRFAEVWELEKTKEQKREYQNKRVKKQEAKEEQKGPITPDIYIEKKDEEDLEEMYAQAYVYLKYGDKKLSPQMQKREITLAKKSQAQRDETTRKRKAAAVASHQRKRQQQSKRQL